MAIGMNDALVDTAREIARLPDLDTERLTLIEGALLLVSSRDGSVSIQSVLTEIKNAISEERLQPIFFAISQASALRREERDRRGISFDRYRVDPDRLHQIMRDARLAMQILTRVQDEIQQTGHVELIATLPGHLHIDRETRTDIPSLAATLHRLITDAETEIWILNPFFERTGFDRLASALLAAADRSVKIEIVTYQLSDPRSFNHQILSRLTQQAKVRTLDEQFTFREYQQHIGDRILPVAHAKMILVDQTKAYIGSANLTEYGMARNLEIGVVLEGRQTEQVRKIFEAILASEQAESVAFKGD